MAFNICVPIVIDLRRWLGFLSGVCLFKFLIGWMRQSPSVLWCRSLPVSFKLSTERSNTSDCSAHVRLEVFLLATVRKPVVYISNSWLYFFFCSTLRFLVGSWSSSSDAVDTVLTILQQNLNWGKAVSSGCFQRREPIRKFALLSSWTYRLIGCSALRRRVTILGSPHWTCCVAVSSEICWTGFRLLWCSCLSAYMGRCSTFVPEESRRLNLVFVFFHRIRSCG